MGSHPSTSTFQVFWQKLRNEKKKGSVSPPYICRIDPPQKTHQTETHLPQRSLKMSFSFGCLGARFVFWWVIACDLYKVETTSVRPFWEPITPWNGTKLKGTLYAHVWYNHHLSSEPPKKQHSYVFHFTSWWWMGSLGSWLMQITNFHQNWMNGGCWVGSNQRFSNQSVLHEQWNVREIQHIDAV